MRQADRKKQKDRVAILLMLCFCVVALTSIFTIKYNIDKINDSQSLVPVSEKASSDAKEDASESLINGEKGHTSGDSTSTEASAIKTIDSRDNDNEEGEGAQAHPLRFPVKSEQAYVLSPYSMDSLLYSVTLDQYMVHCGVDVAAPADTQVLAIADGIVTAIYVDDRYGNSVEITHDDGFITISSNLSDAAMVEIGDTVKAGDIIGGVGATALFESLEPSHLHLEMLKEGAYVDPMDFIQS